MLTATIGKSAHATEASRFIDPRTPAEIVSHVFGSYVGPSAPLIVPTPDYRVYRRKHPLFGDCVYAEWGPGFDDRTYCEESRYVGVEVVR